MVARVRRVRDDAEARTVPPSVSPRSRRHRPSRVDLVEDALMSARSGHSVVGALLGHPSRPGGSAPTARRDPAITLPSSGEKGCPSESKTLLTRRTRVIDTKVCARCKRALPAGAFRPNPRMRCGLHSWCRDCTVARTRRWRAEHPDRVAATNAARREGPFPRTCLRCRHEFLGARRRSKFCPRCTRCRDRHL